MKKLFTLFFALVASVGTMFAWDYERVQIGDLYYNLDATSQTAEVTSSSYQKYSGDIVIPASVTYASVTYGVTSIGSIAFAYCSGLTSVTIPGSVTSIGDGTFYYCTGLTSVTIGNSVTSIGEHAFTYCDGLTSINVASDNSNYCSVDGVLFNKDKTTLIQYPGGKQGAYTIPNSVTSIGEAAFARCTGLTSVTIPNSVTSIGNAAFAYCSGLTSINVASDNSNYCSVDGVLFNKDKTTLIQYPGGKQGAYIIPNSVTSIEDGAFYYCYSLTSLTIGNSVTSIGEGAFYGCSGLTSVTIGNSVTSIGYGAFQSCTSLTSITCEAITPPTLGSDVFYDVNKSIPLYVPAGSIDLYKSAKQWKDFSNILPISARETETTSVQAEPTDNSVSVSWPQVSGAASYELVIKDKDGNVVCTLIFNAQGQLTSIAFNAPSRDGAPQHTQTAGFSFTITGLEAGTDYNLTITAKNENGQEIDKKNVSFHTEGTQDIEDIHVDSSKAIKVLNDGKVYILRGGKTHTITGQEVR